MHGITFGCASSKKLRTMCQGTKDIQNGARLLASLWVSQNVLSNIMIGGPWVLPRRQPLTLAMA